MDVSISQHNLSKMLPKSKYNTYIYILFLIIKVPCLLAYGRKTGRVSFSGQTVRIIATNAAVKTQYLQI